jgi:hypothetical protein
MEYSADLIRTRLRDLEKLPQDERLDVQMTFPSLSRADRTFLAYRLQGYSLRECGRKIGHPDNTSRRFRRICNRVASILNGVK